MRDELLALLEDGPKSARQLADWLGIPLEVLRQELLAMRGDGLLRTFESGWALATFERPRARRRRETTTVATPPAVESTTRIIDGQEYEVVNDCRGPVTEDWPDNAGRESVFSGRGFKVGL